MKVYLVIEDDNEQTTKLVTTNRQRALDLAQDLIAEAIAAYEEDQNKRQHETVGNVLTYSHPAVPVYVRVEEHELEGTAGLFADALRLLDLAAHEGDEWEAARAALFAQVERLR